jgi:hypothetical protein
VHRKDSLLVKFALVAGMLCAFPFILISAGCAGNVPNSVVQAQTASTPAILVGSCPSLTTSNNTAGTNWLFPLGSMASDCSLTGPQGMPMPSPGTLKNLRFLTNLGSGTTFSGTVTVFVNRAATPLACTATATLAAGVTDATCSDTAHQVNVAAGDEVAVQVVMQSGAFSGPRMTLEKQ